MKQTLGGGREENFGGYVIAQRDPKTVVSGTTTVGQIDRGSFQRWHCIVGEDGEAPSH